MSLTALTGLMLGLGLAGSLLLLIATLAGWQPDLTAGTRAHPRSRPGRGNKRADTRIGVGAGSRGNVLWGSRARRRAVAAIGVGLLVAVLTRWPVAAAASTVLIWSWPTMFGAARAGAGQLRRLEGLATWTESLRDTIAGSIGLEEAIKHSVNAAPAVLAPQLLKLQGQLRARIPLPQALAWFAEEFDDASADLVVAALILNSQLRGPGLIATLSALATSAREELDMRRRIEEGRRALRRTALIIVAVTGVFAGGLALFSRDYVAPYSTPFGQIMLTIVLAVFAAGLMWIRTAANLTPPERFLVSVDQVEAALTTNPSAHSEPATQPHQPDQPDRLDQASGGVR